MANQLKAGEARGLKNRDYVDESEGEIDVLKIVSGARRRWKILLTGLVVGVLFGLAQVATTTKLYTSSVQLSLDTSEAANARELTGLQTIGMAESEITTEIHVISSQAIAEKVVDRLELDRNEVFMQPVHTGLTRLKSLVANALGALEQEVSQSVSDVPRLDSSEADVRMRAVGKLRANMNVTRLSDSRVVEVAFTSPSPSLASRIANTIAEVYIADQLDSKYDATQRATEWLKERSDQLRAESARLDNDVEQFKRVSGLVGIENSAASSTDFDTISEQLAAARSLRLEQEARLRFLQDVIDNGDTSAAVSSTSDESITAGLRSRYLNVLKDYNALKGRLGENHEQTLRRQAELEQLQDLMFEEIKRSRELVLSEINVAERRIVQLEKALLRATDQLGADKEVIIKLREMEREAETVRSLYSSFLQRYQQTLQEQSFAVSDVRVLNPAKVPGVPSFPNASLTSLSSAIVGLIAAASWVVFLEVRDNKVRTGEQVRSDLGLEFLGGLQEVAGENRFIASLLKGRTALDPYEVVFPKTMRYGVDKPLSSFAETLRAVKMAVSLQGPAQTASGKVIGAFSCFPGEGKTTSSSNLANLLASQGRNVILIDADLRNPGLTRSLNREINKGLVEILHDHLDWQQAVHRDPDTGVHVIPVAKGRIVHTSELLGGSEMKDLLETLRSIYDYVIVDVPPLAPVIDARSILPMLDGFALVLKWGQTNIKSVENILSQDPRLHEKCYGAILNYFDPRKAKAYGNYSNSYYYGYAYTKYYSDR